MILYADMLCLVQSFQQNKLLRPLSAKDKSSKSRKLLFIKRKKTPSVHGSPEKLNDEKLLHPDIAGNCTVLRKDKDGHSKAVKLPTKIGYILQREHPRYILHLKMKNGIRRNSRQGLRHLSGSAPSVHCALSPSHGLRIPLTPATCPSRQKKFLRHFDVHPDERVIDYFSCALVADILLQGHLYVSKNYFAFYSNVFGYVTKLLIPVSTVTSVTKEKTAFILPNAVAVVTADDRHVFSSLLSRDTTFKLMVQVWREASIVADLAPDINTNKLRCRNVAVHHSGSDSPDVQTEESLCDEPLSNCEPTLRTQTYTDHIPTESHAKLPRLYKDKGAGVIRSAALPRSTVLLAVSTVLLILLFTSAAVLMYRVSLLQQHLTPMTHLPASHRSLLEIQEYLESNLQKLHKVRQSLEVLSLLMENGKENFQVPHNSQEKHVLSPAEETDNIQQIKEQTS